VNGRFPPGVSGNPAKRFQSGVSGNPTGRPKTFSIHRLVAEAIDDKDTRTEAVKRLQDNLKRAKTVVNTLEFAALRLRDACSASGLGDSVYEEYDRRTGRTHYRREYIPAVDQARQGRLTASGLGFAPEAPHHDLHLAALRRRRDAL